MGVVSGRRKAIAPFQFSDGLQVPAGSWVCLPQKAMMEDDRIYAYPTLFDPTRFLRSQDKHQEEMSEAVPGAVNAARPHFTDVNNKWPVWGLKNAAW